MAQRRHQLLVAKYINWSRNENKNKINILSQYASTDLAIYDNVKETWKDSVNKLSNHGCILGKDMFDTDKRVFKQMPFGDDKYAVVLYVENSSDASKRFDFQNQAEGKERNLRDSALIRIATLKGQFGVAGLNEKMKQDVCSQLTF